MLGCLSRSPFYLRIFLLLGLPASVLCLVLAGRPGLVPAPGIPNSSRPVLHTSTPLPSIALALPPSPAQTGPVPFADEHPQHGYPAPKLKDSEQASLYKAFSEARRQVAPLTETQAAMPHNQGARLFAQNPGQRLTARFFDDGTRIESGQPPKGQVPWRAVFSTPGLPSATTITTSGTRVEYQRGPVIEWYDNKPEGIEHGFIITRPQSRDSELRIDVSVDGLTASVPSAATSTVILSNLSNQDLLSYSKLLAWDATGRTLPARLEPTATGVALIVSCDAARYPVTIDPVITSLEQKLGPEVTGSGGSVEYLGCSVAVSGDTALVGAVGDSTASGLNAGSVYVFIRSGSTWSLQSHLMASDATGGDNFGYSVAISGDTALVGAYYDDTSAGEDSGSAYVFIRSGSSWSQQAKLTASDAAASDTFGTSVALSGDTALIGAYNDDIPAGTDAGSAYVFTRTGSSWSQQAKVTASDAASGDNFGASVALSGDTALVGAHHDDTGAGTDAGSAYVFTRSGSTWSQQSKLTNSDAAAGDFSGGSVALDSNTALIGAYGHNSFSGNTYVFIRSGSSWSQQAKLASSDPATGDLFGCNVAISGNTALVGSCYDDLGAGTDAGSVFVFTRSGSSWSQQAKLTVSDAAAGDYLGTSVAISGDTALIGAPFDDTTAGQDAGSAYVFTRSGSSWSPQGKLTASDSAAYDYFGTSVAISGNTALFGTPYDDTAAGLDVGSVYVFIRSGSAWSQQAILTASDAATGDLFGFSIAMDSNTALIGAFYDDTSAGADAGSAYVFTRSGTSWSQQAKLTSSDAAAGDWFGRSVALSADTALIGAPQDDTSAGTDAGSAYVFTRSGSSWSQQAKLTASDGAPGDILGGCVALSGNTALVSAPFDDTPAGTDAGSAYVFTRSGSSWSQQAKLTSSDGAPGDILGGCVALSGDTALVSTTYHTTAAGTGAGSVYVFLRSGTSWSQQARLTASDGATGDYFGMSMALSGDTALVGAPSDDTPGGTDAGSAYVFTRSGSTWSQQLKFTSPDSTAYDGFGASAALYGDTALVTASGDDGYDLTGGYVANPGSAYVYRLIDFYTPDTDGDGVSNAWETGHGFNPNLANDYKTLDTDRDGDTDLLEIFQGTGIASASEHQGLGNISATINPTARQLKTRYRRSTTQTAVLGHFQWSSDLVNWYDPGLDIGGIRVTTSSSVVASGSGYEMVEVTAKVALGAPDKLFLRLLLQPAE